MNKIFTPKYLVILCFLNILSQNIFSQTSIFSENVGTPSATTTIAAYTGWQNNSTLTFSNGGVTTPADVRITSVSSTYTGFSAGGNVFFSSTTGNYGFAIESINATGYSTLSLQFGYRKESAAGHVAFSIEYWDGAAWNVIANTSAALFNEATTAAIGWYLSKPLALPVAAQINGLKIRFVKSGSTYSIRIDDIKLTGQINNPTTTSLSPSSANVGGATFPLTVNGTNFFNTTSTVTWNGANRTTTFVNNTTLTASIPSTDLSSAGTVLVGVTTTGALASSNTQNFTINSVSGGTFTLAAAIAAFGSVCINNTSTTNSFTLNGNNLDGSAITVNGPTGYKFSEAAGGPFNTNTSLTYTGSSFTNKNIYVQFTPTAVQSYNGNIIVNGGGVTNYPVAVTGAGINDAPIITTLSATNITATTANLFATINSSGCSSVTAYGFEYSTTTGFPNGTGTQVVSSNLSAGNFSATITGLSPNTRYYYKAIATNSIGTTYGAQLAFTCTPLPVLMSAEPSLSFTETFADIANWGSFFSVGIGANHWGGLSATTTAPATGIPNATITTASTSSFQSATSLSSGGVQKGTDQAPSTQSIVLLSTGSPDNNSSTAIDFYMDFTGVNANTLSFDYAVVNNSTGDRNGSLRVYSSTDGTTFVEIANAAILSFKNNIVFNGSKTNIQLPTSFNNSSTARLRFYYSNGDGGTTGSRPKISIDNLNITAVATITCATPSAPATALSFGTITDVSIQASFTAASPATDSYLIVMSTNNSLTSNPTNGQTYNIGDNVGDGSVISKGTTTSFTATGLTAQTTYYFFIFPMNAICTGGPLYYTTPVLNGSATTVAGLPPCAAPTSQPTNLIFSTTTINSIAGSFTATSADQYLVVRSTSGSLSSNPVNGTLYNAGDALGNGTIVQRSNATTFNATGLASNTTYTFFIFSSNSQACVNGPAYNVTTPLTASQATLPLPACVTPTSQPLNLVLTATNNLVSASFTGVSGADNYLVIKSTSPTLGATPTNNTDYTVGAIFGSGTVVSNSSNTTFLANNLTQNTTYYFFVFAADKNCSGGTKYATQAPLTGNITTTNNAANNYYFGTLHSHSDYSDGNKDNPGFTPTNDYSYAMVSQCMDFLGISEHNHFSSANNPGNQIANYHQGSTQANNFSAANPNFLAMYGMEWGVISGGGHVVVYGDGMDDLWGWESGSGVWGSTNNYDTYVPKSTYTGSTGIFKTVNDNILKNTFATLAHPGSSDFNNLANIAYDAVADSAIVGAAIESGPANSTNTTYTDPGTSLSYLSYYQLLLSKGYHLGPTIDHDNHNTTFGRATYSRTAVVAPSLTKTSIVSALRNMHFYATQDCDTKVDFTINTKIMGSIFTNNFAPNISVSLTDVTTSVSSAIIKIMYGIPGSGTTAVNINSVTGSSLQYTDNNLANLATGYYYIDITNGASRIITSPIWYTRNDASSLPVKLSAFTVQKKDKSAQLDWVTDIEVNSSHFIIQRSIDGRNWNDIARVNAEGNSSISKAYMLFDNTPLNGINYYRLKQIDLDGKFEYSIVKSAQFNLNYQVEISPNPAKDFITINTTQNSTKVIYIELVDISGKVLKKLSSTQNKTKLNVAGIAKGIYFVKVNDADNVVTQRIVIE